MFTVWPLGCVNALAVCHYMLKGQSQSGHSAVRYLGPLYWCLYIYIYIYMCVCVCVCVCVSVQFSLSVVSNSLQPHRLQDVRLPCPSPTPRACSNSCPLSRWCHPTSVITTSVIPFSSHLQSFPASGSFPIGQFFTSGGQSIGASASVLPMNIQGLFPLGLIGLIFLQFKGLSRVFSNTAVQKHQFFSAQLSLWSNSHIHTQSLPSGSFHNLLILIHQRADRMKTTITGNWPNWSHEPQPCLTQWNYEPCLVGPPKTDRSW